MIRFVLENLFIGEERRQERKWLTRRDKEEKDTWQSFLNNRGNNRKEGGEAKQSNSSETLWHSTINLNWDDSFQSSILCTVTHCEKSLRSKIYCRLNFSIVRNKLRPTFQAQSLATLRIRFAKFQIVPGNLRNLRMPPHSVKQDTFTKTFFPLDFTCILAPGSGDISRLGPATEFCKSKILLFF